MYFSFGKLDFILLFSSLPDSKCIFTVVRAVYKSCQQSKGEGGRGVWKLLTITDKGEEGCQANADSH